MINLNKFKCKNCKRGYKDIGTFLERGVCIPCIKKALLSRQTGKAFGIQKTKGKHLQTNKRQLAPARPATKKFDENLQTQKIFLQAETHNQEHVIS
jgi:hypothetical protein